MEFGPHLVLLFFYAAGALSVAMALLTFSRRSRKFTWPFALISLLVAWWTFIYIGELNAADLQVKFCCVKLEYLAIATIPTLWLFFVARCTGHNISSGKKFLALFFVEPVITLLVVWTNEYHHLFYRTISLAPGRSFVFLDITYGIWYWVHIAYSYILATVVVALILDGYRNDSWLSRKRDVLILLAATFFPWGGNFIASRLWLGPHIDPTPILLTVGLLIASICMWKIRMIDVIPTARYTAIEEMADAYMLMDNNFYIIDLNRAAEMSFGRPKSELVSRHFSEVAPANLDVDELTSMQLPVRRVVERSGAYYDVNTELITSNNGQRLGILVTWRDVTEHVTQKQLLEERVSQLNSINFIIETINQATTLNEVYGAAMHSIRETLRADKSSVSLFDPSGVIRFAAWSGLSQNFRETVEGYSVLTPQSTEFNHILVDDVQEVDTPPIADMQDVFREEGIRALAVMPIVHQERLLGKLITYYSSPHHFTHREVELLEIVAGHLAIAVEKMRLLDQAQNRLRRMEVIHHIDSAISATLDLDHQIDILLTHVIAELNCDISVLFLVDKATHKIMPMASRGSYSPQMQQCTYFEIGEGGVGWIVLHKQNLYIPDVTADERWQQTKSSTIDQIVSYLGIPLIVDGEVIGVLDVSSRTRREFTHEEIEFLRMLGGQAAIAIKNARLYQDLQKKVSQLEALNDISRELMSEHDVDTLLQEVLVEATRLLHVPHGVIFLYDESRELLSVAADSSGRARSMPIGEGFAGRVALTRRPMLLEDYSQWKYRSPRYDNVQIGAILGVPIMQGGELIGVLVVYDLNDNQRIFTDEDIQILSLLSSQAASAVYNAQLIKRLHQRINRLQTLHQISAELSKLKGKQDSCQSVARLVYEHRGYDSVYIILLDRITKKRELVECLGRDCQRIDDMLLQGYDPIEKTIAQKQIHYRPGVFSEDDNQAYSGGSRSEVYVPIHSRERLFGVLAVESDKADAFDQEDFDTLQTVANQLAIALENAQRMEELSSLLEITTRLYQASQAVGKAKGVRETAITSVRSLRNVFDTEAVFIHVIGNGHNFTYGVDRYDDEIIDEANKVLEEADYAKLESIQSITLLQRDELPDKVKLPGVNRAIAFPLKRGSVILGGIIILLSKETFVSRQQMDLLAIYANQTTIAIEKAISMEQVKHRALEQEVVSSIVRSLNKVQDVKRAFPKLAAGISRLVEADRISVALPDDERQGFILFVLKDDGSKLFDGQWNSLESSAAIADVQAGKVHITPDLSQELMYPVEAKLYDEGYRSRINIPLKAGDEVLGSLNIMSRKLNEFTPEKLPPLFQIADALAISTANSLSIKEERRRARELTLLYSLSRTLSSLNSVEEAMQAVVEVLREGLHGVIHARGVFVNDQFRNYITPKAYANPHYVWVSNLDAYPILAHAIAENDCFMVQSDDPNLSSSEKELLFSRPGVNAWLLPLAQDDDIIGVLVMEWNKNQCNDSESRLVKSIAELLMMTLRRVFLFYEVEGAYFNAVLSLALASDAKDSYTADHSQRLEMMAVNVAKEMGLSQSEIEDLRFGARLHDIGKIGVPDAILKKPGPLTDEEWEIMHKHPEIGENILAPLARLRGAAKIVRHHHERYDGQGYPDGLTGDEIPIGARILSVVDAYSAITDRRVYKSARKHEDAIAEIKKSNGKQFDPQVVEVFLKLYEANPPSRGANVDE